MYIIPKIASSVLNYSRNNVAPPPSPHKAGTSCLPHAIVISVPKLHSGYRNFKSVPYVLVFSLFRIPRDAEMCLFLCRVPANQNLLCRLFFFQWHLSTHHVEDPTNVSTHTTKHPLQYWWNSGSAGEKQGEGKRGCRYPMITRQHANEFPPSRRFQTHQSIILPSLSLGHDLVW